jgi:hypothetical protein
MGDITFTPRNDFVRTIPISVNFQLFGPERRVPLGAADRGILLDLFLSINTCPTPLLKGGPNEITCPQDLKLGIGYFADGNPTEVDLTEEVLAHLREALDASDQPGVKKAYRAGMDYFLSTLIPVWNYSETQTSAVRDIAAALLTVDRVSTHLTQLGGPKIGETLGGALYVSNYLYTFIPVPPIPLGQLLEKRNINLQKLQAPYFWISHLKGQKTIGGQAEFLLQAAYHNELIDEFDDLEHKIKVRLLEIHEKLAADGPIVQGIVDAKDNIMRVTRQLKDFEAALADQKNQIRSLQSTDAGILARIETLLTLGEQWRRQQQQRLPGVNPQ